MATNNKIFKVRSGNLEMMSSGGFPYEVSVEDDGSLSTQINASVPGAPTNFSITSNIDQLSISWSPPNNIGNSSIISYILEYSTSASGSYTTHSTNLTTSRNITGLLSETVYFVRVQAVNTIGGGLYASGSKKPGIGVGDTGPGNGIVFYDAGSNQAWGRFLEAAPQTWYGGSSDPSLPWSNAVTAAASYNGGSKTDWFLPSRNQLTQLHTNRAIVGNLIEEYYWSSTQANGDESWARFFTASNTEIAITKESSFRVRPIRAF